MKTLQQQVTHQQFELDACHRRLTGQQYELDDAHRRIVQQQHFVEAAENYVINLQSELETTQTLLRDAEFHNTRYLRFQNQTKYRGTKRDSTELDQPEIDDSPAKKLRFEQHNLKPRQESASQCQQDEMSIEQDEAMYQDYETQESDAESEHSFYSCIQESGVPESHFFRNSDADTFLDALAREIEEDIARNL